MKFLNKKSVKFPGIKQSGDMNFKLANINSDYKILKKCIEDSEEVLKNIMENNEYPELKLIINSLNNLN